MDHGIGKRTELPEKITQRLRSWESMEASSLWCSGHAGRPNYGRELVACRRAGPLREGGRWMAGSPSGWSRIMRHKMILGSWQVTLSEAGIMDPLEQPRYHGHRGSRWMANAGCGRTTPTSEVTCRTPTNTTAYGRTKTQRPPVKEAAQQRALPSRNCDAVRAWLRRAQTTQPRRSTEGRASRRSQQPRAQWVAPTTAATASASVAQRREPKANNLILVLEVLPLPQHRLRPLVMVFG